MTDIFVKQSKSQCFKSILATIIWYLKIYGGGKYCTFPHARTFFDNTIEAELN